VKRSSPKQANSEEANVDTMFFKHTVIVGSPELLAFQDARSSCDDADIEFPFRSFVAFRNAVGERPATDSMLVRLEGEPARFAWM
jgi:hypothetical protein